MSRREVALNRTDLRKRLLKKDGALGDLREITRTITGLWGPYWRLSVGIVWKGNGSGRLKLLVAVGDFVDFRVWETQ